MNRFLLTLKVSDEVYICIFGTQKRQEKIEYYLIWKAIWSIDLNCRINQKHKTIPQRIWLEWTYTLDSFEIVSLILRDDIHTSVEVTSKYLPQFQYGKKCPWFHQWVHVDT